MRNWRTMAVFLGPRQTMALEREGSRSAREMAWRAPIGFVADGAELALSSGSRWAEVLFASAVAAAPVPFVPVGIGVPFTPPFCASPP